MRILYHHRIRSKDGQYVHLEEMVHALRAQGHQVEIVGPRHVETEEFGSDAGIVSVLKRWMPGPGYELAELAYSLADYRRLSAAIRRFQPDVIYERYNLYFPSGVWAKTTTWSAAVARGQRSAVRGAFSLRRHRAAASCEVERAHVRGAARISCCRSRRCLRDRVAAAGVPAERIHVIPNGINTREFADLPSSCGGQAASSSSRDVSCSASSASCASGMVSRGCLKFMAHSAERERLFALFVGDGPVRGSTRGTCTGARPRGQPADHRRHAAGAGAQDARGV